MSRGIRTPFLLDTNVFIQAKNQYYSFSICPGFWEAVTYFNLLGKMYSIDHVQRELTEGKDDLASWAKSPSSLFLSTSSSEIITHFASIMNWVHTHPRYHDSAKSEFASVADGWLVAAAKVHGMTVVTHEAYAPEARNRVLIPNLCKQFNIAYTNTFGMLDSLEIYFGWTPPQPK